MHGRPEAVMSEAGVAKVYKVSLSYTCRKNQNTHCWSTYPGYLEEKSVSVSVQVLDRKKPVVSVTQCREGACGSNNDLQNGLLTSIPILSVQAKGKKVPVCIKSDTGGGERSTRSAECKKSGSSETGSRHSESGCSVWESRVSENEK